MGVRGPIPKPTTQRHGHRKKETAAKAEPTAGAAAPAASSKSTRKPVAGGKTTGRNAARRRTYTAPLAQGHWHPMAKRWWQGLRASEQTAYYQPSDWEHALVWTEFLSRQLLADKPSAMMLASWDSAMARLLVTEGDRRRVQLELTQPDKPEDPDKAAGVASMEAWREKLAGGVS